MIRLTQDQIDILVDRVDPDYVPAWLPPVEAMRGARVVKVGTVEESTPYVEGWLAVETEEWVANAREEKRRATEQHRLRVAEAAERVARISAPLMERLASR